MRKKMCSFLSTAPIEQNTRLMHILTLTSSSHVWWMETIGFKVKFVPGLRFVNQARRHNQPRSAPPPRAESSRPFHLECCRAPRCPLRINDGVLVEVQTATMGITNCVGWQRWEVTWSLFSRRAFSIRGLFCPLTSFLIERWGGGSGLNALQCLRIQPWPFHRRAVGERALEQTFTVITFNRLRGDFFFFSWKRFFLGDDYHNNWSLTSWSIPNIVFEGY